jgi:hypothetical protein
VRFAVHVPSAGDYRLFLDFSHGGQVRTAAYTAQVERPAVDDSDGQDGREDHGGH